MGSRLCSGSFFFCFKQMDFVCLEFHIRVHDNQNR